MAIFSSDNPKEKKESGILGAFSVNLIKYEPELDAEASYVAHKFPYEDFPNGSILLVGQSQIAVFINNMEADDSLNPTGEGRTEISIFKGPCKIKLDTGDSRFAPFRNVAHKLTGGESAYHSLVYFVNTNYMNNLNWGTQSPFIIQDPEEEVNIHVRAYGVFGTHIESVDSTKCVVMVQRFLRKVVGTRADYTQNDLLTFMRAQILKYVPDLLATMINERKIGILKITEYLEELSQIIQGKLVDTFDEFGLTLDHFSFHNITPDENDLAAVNEMKIKRKRDQLDAQGNAMKMDIESEARARMRAREGYTYQQEQAYGVMRDAANNEGSGSGLMGAGLGLGMGVGIGGSVGAGMHTIAQQTMNNMQMRQNIGGGIFSQNLHANQGENASAEGNVGNTGETIICQNCGAVLPKEAKFCFNCGTKIEIGRICPNCGTVNPTTAKFCMNCGGPLEEKKKNICPNCGKEVTEGAMFCTNCGTKLH